MKEITCPGCEMLSISVGDLYKRFDMVDKRLGALEEFDETVLGITQKAAENLKVDAKLFEEIYKRFEQFEKRFDELEKKLKRFDELFTFDETRTRNIKLHVPPEIPKIEAIE